MAKVSTEKKSVDVGDNSPIAPACEELGVPFACYEGICGTCKIKILDGSANLTEPTDKEKESGVDLASGERLACQVKIKKGEVKISF